MSRYYTGFVLFGGFFYNREMKIKHPHTEPKKPCRVPSREPCYPDASSSSSSSWANKAKPSPGDLCQALEGPSNPSSSAEERSNAGGVRKPLFHRGSLTAPRLSAVLTDGHQHCRQLKTPGFVRKPDISSPIAVIYSQPCSGHTSPPAASAFFFFFSPQCFSLYFFSVLWHLEHLGFLAMNPVTWGGFSALQSINSLF